MADRDASDHDAAETAIAGLWRIRPKAVTDERGTVREFFRTSAFGAPGVPCPTAGRRST